MRWVLPHGALGVATGAIAIGTVATLRSTTIIITIATTISTAMPAARDKVIGSTIRNTAEMLRMETGKQPINSADVAPVVRVALVVPAALVASEDRVVPEDPVVRENPAVRAALVVSESPAVPVALELQTVPVAVLERELDQVAVVLVRDHLRARLAAALRTKSVTAAHPHDLVPLLEAAEDLAAVAETTREPAAAEAVIAWEVAE